MHGAIGICQDARKHKEREDGFCPRWIALVPKSNQHSSTVSCRVRAQLISSLRLIFIVQLLFCSTYLFAADAVSLSGYFTVLTQDGLHKPLPQLCSSNEFQVLVCRDGRWAINVRSLAKEDDISYLTFDGKDTYSVHYQNSIMGMTNGQPDIIATEPFTNHINRASISAGGYPFNVSDPQGRAQVLWLAFDAGSYLHDHPQKSMPLPWAYVRWNLAAYGFRMEYELSENAPNAIRSLKFIRSTALDLPDNEEFDRPELDNINRSVFEKTLEQRKKELPDGFVEGIFRGSESTNYHSMELPLAFAFKVFNPHYKKDDFSRKYEGIVTNVAEADSLNFSLPPIQSELRVKDERRRYKSAAKIETEVDYRLKPAENWLSKDALASQQFEAVIHDPVSDRKRYLGKLDKELIVKIALLISTVLPIIIFIIIRFKPKLPPSKKLYTIQ